MGQYEQKEVWGKIVWSPSRLEQNSVTNQNGTSKLFETLNKGWGRK